LIGLPYCNLAAVFCQTMDNLDLETIEKLIKEKEEKYQRELSRNADKTVLTELKKDLEFFRQKRAEIFKKNTTDNKS
jgi:hypothetical protein